MKYPYEPKSNNKLEIGEFWSIPLPNGEFGCGVIIEIPDKNEKRMRFTAGLLNWIGNQAPTESILKFGDLKIIRFGNVHIKTILSRGEKIRGKIEIENIGNIKISNLKELSTWGYNFINLLAEKLQESRTKVDDSSYE